MDLLIRANHRDEKSFKGNRLIVVKRGQVLTSQVALAKRWNWNRKTVKNFLLCLQQDQMLDIQTSKRTDTGYTLLTIRNYDKFQVRDADSLDIQNRSSLDIERTSSGHPLPTNKNVKNVKKGNHSSSSGREIIDRSNPSFAGLSEKQKRKGPLAAFREKCESLGLNPLEEYERTKGDIVKLGKREEG